MIKYINPKHVIIILVIVLWIHPWAYSEMNRDRSKPEHTARVLTNPIMPGEFVRFVKKPGSESLQTAIIRYENQSGIIVDLIAAIHVADRGYYEKLNTLFDGYDNLLFEMITDNPRYSRKKTTNKDEFAITTAQNMLKTMLGLEHQADIINYTKKHFVHADISMSLFRDLQRKNNTSLYNMMIKASQAYEKQARKNNKQTEQLTFIDLLVFLLSEDSKREMKLWLAPQLAAMLNVISGNENGIAPLVIIKRNQVAIKVLQEKMSQGIKKLALFYGAAHMPHFERQLVYSLGFTRTTTTWITAWDLAKKNDGD